MEIQQLLLYVIELCLITIAIFAGYTMVQNFFQESNRDQLLDRIFKIYQSAVQYRKTHGSLGGGGGSFTGWKIPDQLIKNNSGTINLKSEDNYIVLIGEGSVTGWDGETCIRVWVRFHDINGRTIRFSN